MKADSPSELREKPFTENFREFLERLRAAKQLVDVRQSVDIRHIATLVDQANVGLVFHDVIGYDYPVVSGIIRTPERAIMSMGCTNYREIESMLDSCAANGYRVRELLHALIQSHIFLGQL